MDLEFSKIHKEDRGDIVAGRLKLTSGQIVFKNQKTGKLDTLTSNDLESFKWQRMSDGYCLRIVMKSGHLYRYGGFEESQKFKLEKFIKQNYSLDMPTQDFSIRGWNWGNAAFEGAVMNFNVKEDEKVFEIPLSNVSNCTTAKNEVTLEMHQNDDVSVSLMEMRFHIPSVDGVDPVQAFMEQVLQKASIIRETGDYIAVFDELQCLTPRGRYDIKFYPTYIQLHGKTFDYKITISSVLRLFQLPHKDSKQVYFVLSLDPPIKQGQTRYHFLILVFQREEEITIELRLSEKEIAQKYDGKIEKKMTGPIIEVFARLMRSIVQRKVTFPDKSFSSSNSGMAAVYCSYKASYGLLYPLERGFIYLHKPPVHIRFDEIAHINFARGGGTTRSFDFEIATKTDMVHTFSSIEKEQYSPLYDFVKGKGLKISNVGMEDNKKRQAIADELLDSDMEDSDNDAYLHRVREEGKIRQAGDDDDDESEDEDFNPDAEKLEDVADEFDSDPSDSSEEDGSDAGSDASASHKKKKHKAKKEKKEKKPKKEKKEKSSKKSKKADDGRPKRPQSAFFLWMGETRESIKKENPGMGVADVAKRAGELWKEVTDKSKWEEMNAKLKVQYEKDMEEFKRSGKAVESSSKSSSSKHKSSKSSSSSPTKSPTKPSGSFKSQEYIDSSDDSSGKDSDDKSKKKKSHKKPKKEAKKPKKEEVSDVEMKSELDDSEEEILSSPTASSESESD